MAEDAQATKNQCAGPFGAAYDLWIERERVARVVGRLAYGIDTRPMYASMRRAIGTVGPGGVIIDVPCGGGIAFRALERNHRVRYLAVDLADSMLDRARRRAAERGLGQVELLVADMRRLPFADGSADLALSYSGLHMIPDPELALRELGRCLRSGGQLVGTTFLAQGNRRQRLVFWLGHWTGHVRPSGSAADLERWLSGAGFDAVEVAPRCGFVLFRGRRR